MILDIPTQSTASTPIDSSTETWSATRTYQPIAFPSEDEYGRVFAMWTRADGAKIIVSALSGYFNIVGNSAIFTEKNHPQSNVASIKFAYCAAPAFTVPIGARSFTIQNISGADMWVRSYVPSYAETGHLIDIIPQVLTLDDTVVGMKLADGQTQSYLNGSFTPGASFVIAASSAAPAGCAVEFAY